MPFEGHSTSTALQVWKISHHFFHHFMTDFTCFTYLWPWLVFLFSWNCVSLVGKLERCCQIQVCLLWHHVKHFKNTKVRRLARLSIYQKSMTFDPDQPSMTFYHKIKALQMLYWPNINAKSFWIILLFWSSICCSSFSSLKVSWFMSEKKKKKQKFRVQEFMLKKRDRHNLS